MSVEKNAQLFHCFPEMPQLEQATANARSTSQYAFLVGQSPCDLGRVSILHDCTAEHAIIVVLISTRIDIVKHLLGRCLGRFLSMVWHSHLLHGRALRTQIALDRKQQKTW